MNVKLGNQDQEILASLINEDILTQKQIDDLSNNQKIHLDNLKDNWFEKIYSLEQKNRQLKILDGKGKELGLISLSTESKTLFKSIDWQNWGDGVISLDSENKKVGSFSSNPEKPTTLAFRKNQFYLINPEVTDERYLIKTQNYLFESIPKNKTESYPLDIFTESTGKIMVITLVSDERK